MAADKLIRTSQISDLIREHLEQGLQIVPVIGAGLSVKSGIPVVAGLRTYFKHIAKRMSMLSSLMIDKGIDKKNHIDAETLNIKDMIRLKYILQPPDLREELGQMLKLYQGESVKNVIERARIGGHEICKNLNCYGLVGLNKKVEDSNETYNEDDNDEYLDWLHLLEGITDSNQTIIDYVFDRLKNNRKPSMNHRYWAFLIGKINCKLVLTTNFDSFLEDALNQNDRETNIFEINSEDGFPDAELVKLSNSLIKLHGGNYGLRADRSVNHPIRSDIKQKIVDCIPRKSLIIVIGNGGKERRITDLIETILKQKECKLVWIHRERHLEQMTQVKQIADNADYAGRISTFNCFDTGQLALGVFLHLYNTMPTSKLPYSAICALSAHYVNRNNWIHAQTISSVFDEKINYTFNSYKLNADVDLADYKFPSTANSCLLLGNVNSISDSDFLHEKAIQSGKEVIWVSLRNFSSLHTVVNYILRNAKSIDNGINHIIRPSNPNLNRVSEADLKKYICVVIRLLRRGDYILCIENFEHMLIDSMSDGFMNKRGLLLDPILDFATRLLVECAMGHAGDSVIAVLVRDTELSSKMIDTLKNAGKDKQFKVNLFHLPVIDVSSFSYYDSCKASVSSIVSAYYEKIEFKNKQLPSLISDLIIALISCFRRSRPVNAVSTLISAILSWPKDADVELQDFSTLSVSGQMYSDKITMEVLNTANCIIQKLLEPILYGNVSVQIAKEHPSGFLWLDYNVRKNLYDNSLQALTDLVKNSEYDIGYIEAQIHSNIAAHYYRHVFIPSRDVAVLHECLFHRLLSLTCLPKENLSDQTIELVNKRLKYLDLVVSRDYDILLAGRDPMQASRTIYILICKLLDWHSDIYYQQYIEHCFTQLLNTLYKLIAEVCRDGLDFTRCMKFLSKIDVNKNKDLCHYVKTERLYALSLTQLIELKEPDINSFDVLCEEFEQLEKQYYKASDKLKNDWEVLAINSSRHYLRKIEIQLFFEGPIAAIAEKALSLQQAVLNRDFANALKSIRLLEYSHARDFHKLIGILNTLRVQQLTTVQTEDIDPARMYADFARSAFNAASSPRFCISHSAVTMVAFAELIYQYNNSIYSKTIRAMNQADRLADDNVRDILVRLDSCLQNFDQSEGLLREAREKLYTSRTYIDWWLHLHFLWTKICLKRHDIYFCKYQLSKDCSGLWFSFLCLKDAFHLLSVIALALDNSEYHQKIFTALKLECEQKSRDLNVEFRNYFINSDQYKKGLFTLSIKEILAGYAMIDI